MPVPTRLVTTGGLGTGAAVAGTCFAALVAIRTTAVATSLAAVPPARSLAVATPMASTYLAIVAVRPASSFSSIIGPVLEGRPFRVCDSLSGSFEAVIVFSFAAWSSITPTSRSPAVRPCHSVTIGRDLVDKASTAFSRMQLVVTAS